MGEFSGTAKPNEHCAHVVFRGDFDPELLSQELGIHATKSWRKGPDERVATWLHNQSHWSLASRLLPGVALEEHITDVLMQMDVNTIAFRDVSLRFEGRMQLVGRFYQYYPGLYLERALVLGLAKYSLSVDFDFYHHYAEPTKVEVL